MNPESADGSLPGRLLVLGQHRQGQEVGDRHQAHSLREILHTLIFATGMEREMALSPACAKEEIVVQKLQNHRIKTGWVWGVADIHLLVLILSPPLICQGRDV